MNLPMTAATTRPCTKKLAYAYLLAKQAVIDAGFEDELCWQNTVRTTQISESTFLSEAAWVVLSAGMSAAVIGRIFPDISSAFLNWESAQAISKQSNKCREAALVRFNNGRKIEAILYIASHVSDRGFDFVRKSIEVNALTYLTTLPFMGPATSAHLAKNLGVQIAKPDRHLNRIALANGFESAQQICEVISEYVGDDIPEVDLVLWRFATINKHYLEHFKRHI